MVLAVSFYMHYYMFFFLFVPLRQILKPELCALQFSVADCKDTRGWLNANAPEYLPSTLKHMQLIEHE